jgi:diguanylate cyclase (GGDEF)-like protein
MLAGSQGTTAELIVNAAYPLGDLLLVSLVVTFVGLSGAGRGRSWLLLGLGFFVFSYADTLYLYELTKDTYEHGSALDSMWLLGVTLMALAAWQRPPATSADPGWRAHVVPLAAWVISLGVLIAAGLGHLSAIAVAFAAAAQLAAIARTALTVRELRHLAETRRQASTDELTGLPNRRWFDRALSDAIGRAHARGGSLALLVIDLDHFKELNDTLGHHAGDRVLAQLGARIRPALGPDDVAARLGGDEFAVLIEGADEAEPAGARIATALGERFTVEGIELRLAASIGIALYPEHGEDAETLLQRADVAMYQAKSRRSGAEFYSRERDRHTRERLQLIGELRDAVAQDRLTLHYQPKLDLGRGRINGVEALVRWPHPERGMVPPDEFIPLAEQTGVIAPLTDLVVSRALRQAAAWRANGLDLTMAVNVSATCLLEPGWTEGVLEAIGAHRVRPDRVVLEITEDVLMTDPERSLSALARLSGAGVRISLDDFGTGYSSLVYIKKLPVDELKIDRSFVIGMGHGDRADAAIVQTAIDLGRRLGIGVVAEGVEDGATLRRLADYGVDVAQGYHVARPMPAAGIESWLAAGGFHQEDVEDARPVDAFDAIQLDVRRRART